MAENRRIKEPMELVYFIFPTCDGHCAHCWSSDMILGRYKDAAWHGKMLDSLAKQHYSYKEIKLSGGEPFFNPDIGKIADLVRTKIGNDIPITIFTSGRPFVSCKEGPQGVLETKENLKKIIGNFENLSIQMSVDEYHLAVLNEKNYCDTKTYIYNFILACEEIGAEEKGFRGPKLKIHCEEGRKNYHKEQIFAWFPLAWWEKYAILTEGLVCSGNAKNLRHTFEIKPSDRMSYFLLPGVDFYESPVSKRAEMFYEEESKLKLYLDDSDTCSIMVEGWWNLIDRKPVFQRINND